MNKNKNSNPNLYLAGGNTESKEGGNIVGHAGWGFVVYGQGKEVAEEE